MNIVAGRPPNFDAIAAVFPQAHRAGTIFAYGDRVYVSDGSGLSPALRAHEAVHLYRQKLLGGPETWWTQYLLDRAFMLDEELRAHRAEYGVIRSTERDRNRHAAHLNAIAGRLAGPLYGHALTLAEAKRLILRGAP